VFLNVYDGVVLVPGTAPALCSDFAFVEGLHHCGLYFPRIIVRKGGGGPFLSVGERKPLRLWELWDAPQTALLALAGGASLPCR
jgi:hypothetical protein